MKLQALKQHTTTLVLSALVVAGLIYLRFVDRGSVTTAESEARKRNLLPAFRMDGLSEVRVFAQGKNARLYRGKEDEDGERPWMLELEGKHYPTDHQTVDQFLGSLDLGVAERKVDEQSISLAGMKLTEPRVRVSLTMDGKDMVLNIGGEAPTPPGAAYAQTQGQGPVVITAQLFSALNIDPEAFRARAFSPYLVSELGSIGLRGEGGTRKLVRADFGSSRTPAFRLDGSGALGKTRVRGAYVEQLLFALSNLQAERFLSAEQVNALPPPTVTLSLVPRDEKQPTFNIELGAPCPIESEKDDWVAAVRRDETNMAACVPKTVMEPLAQSEEAIADKQVFAATADAISELKISMGSEVLELARKDKGWHERAPHDRDIDADIGKSLVDSLLALSGTPASGNTDTKSGLEKPRAVLRVISAAEAESEDAGPGERIEEVEVGAEHEGFVYVRRLEDDSVLSVPADRASVLFPNELSLRSLQILSEPIKRLRALRIREGGRFQAFERTDTGSWALLSPNGKGLAADIGLVSDAAELLGGLRAERWISAEHPERYGLASPRMVIEAELGDEDSPEKEGEAHQHKTIKLSIGAAASDGSFAKLEGEDAVFVLPKSFEPAFSRWLFDRAALNFDTSAIRLVRLNTPSGKQCTVERGPNGLLSAGGDCASDGELPAKVRDTLSDLFAEGAASMGAAPKNEGFERPALTLAVQTSAEGKPKEIRLQIGAKDVFRGTEICYVRREGIDLSYAVQLRKLKPLLDALGSPSHSKE